MIKVNNLSKWGLVIAISFGCGLIFSYMFRVKEPVKVIEKKVVASKHIRTPTELGEEARKKYQELIPYMEIDQFDLILAQEALY